MILTDILFYLALIAAPCAACLLIYGTICKAHHIYRANQTIRRIKENRQEIRRQLNHD